LGSEMGWGGRWVECGIWLMRCGRHRLLKTAQRTDTQTDRQTHKSENSISATFTRPFTRPI